MDATTTEAMPVRPVNTEQPLTYPTAYPATLSQDAQALYESASYSYGRLALDRDVFDPQARRQHVDKETAKTFEPTQRMLAAIDELVGAGLASYRPRSEWSGASLTTTRIHSQYTVAHGNGMHLVQVEVLEHPRDDRGSLLAVIVGATIRQSEGKSISGLDTWTVQAEHETATDFEHDTSKTASIEIVAPTPVRVGYVGELTFAGVLGETHLYPLGADPLDQSDRDTQAGSCDGLDSWSREQTHDPHPFAPFLPPHAHVGSGVLVKVTAHPIRPYLVASR